MAQIPLVDHQISDGKSIIDALREGGFSLNAALWWYSMERGWSLMIAGEQVQKEGSTAAYRKLHDVLVQRDLSELLTRVDVQMVEPKHRLISLLRDYFHGQHVRNRPLKQGVLNGQTIPEAYLYLM
jgi:hypothetical protein